MSKDIINVSEVIYMAWQDKISFDSIYIATGLTEAQVITLMRQYLKPVSFKLWRKRVNGSRLKHKIKYECSVV